MIIKKRKLINYSIIFVAIVAIIFGIIFYLKLNRLEGNSKNKEEQKRIENIIKEKKDLLSKVSELYNFPEGEEPTVATVSDPTLLKDQAFFTSSQIGDKVLIFIKSGKAVLYRPSINKIIDIVLVQKK